MHGGVAPPDYVSHINEIRKLVAGRKVDLTELKRLFKHLNNGWSDSKTEILFEQMSRSDNDQICLDELVDWLFDCRVTPPLEDVEPVDDFKACSLHDVLVFSGLYVGIETEDEGAVRFEMAIDSAEFTVEDQILSGVLHWKSLDDGFWFGKRGREFVKGQVSRSGTFRVAGEKCIPPSGLIECCMYVLQLASDGSRLYGTFLGASGSPFVLQRLSEADAAPWRAARQATPDCDENGHVPLPACSQGHIMKLSAAFFDGHPCDACFVGMACGAAMFDCTPCNYGLCLKCAASVTRQIGDNVSLTT